MIGRTRVGSGARRRGWRAGGRGDAGFTLIEVMTAVACIGILAAIAVAVLLP